MCRFVFYSLSLYLLPNFSIPIFDFKIAFGSSHSFTYVHALSAHGDDDVEYMQSGLIVSDYNCLLIEYHFFLLEMYHLQRKRNGNMKTLSPPNSEHLSQRKHNNKIQIERFNAMFSFISHVLHNSNDDDDSIKLCTPQ